MYLDLAVEAVSVSVGVGSAISNFRSGNIGSGFADLGFAALDVGLAFVPGVPGGTGLLRQGGKQALKHGDTVVDAARGGGKAGDVVAGGNKAADAVPSKVPEKVSAGGGDKPGGPTAKDISDGGGSSGGGGTGGGAGSSGGSVYDVGLAKDLRKNPVAGTEVNHAPGSAPASTLVGGHNPANKFGNEPAIRLPQSEHGAVSAAQNALPAQASARDLLAKEARILRNKTEAPNSAIQKVIQKNKETHPWDYRKTTGGN